MRGSRRFFTGLSVAMPDFNTTDDLDADLMAGDGKADFATDDTYAIIRQTNPTALQTVIAGGKTVVREGRHQAD